MESEAWVLLALKQLGSSQKDLALRLGVSPTQISKWKKGEHMSYDMERRFREITGIGEKMPKFVLSAGSLEEAEKWERLIQYLAVLASDGAETGYDTRPLQEETLLLCGHLFDILEKIGAGVPPLFPEELDPDNVSETDDAFFDAIGNNPHTELIQRIFSSLTNVYGFYAAYIAEIVDDDSLDLFEIGSNVEACLIDLAVCKIDVDFAFAPKFQDFKRQTTKKYTTWLSAIKDKAFRAGVPLRAELLDMIHESHDALGCDAEQESFGLVDTRLHPDIYMNELLCGMRAIHQFLPAIMKKLGIYEEFEIDTSEFYLGRQRNPKG
jgi:transcriptional regulator with XRE-family HTH domain